VFDECYHFASYIFKNNTIYKLDGDAPGPILVKRLDDQDWIPWLSAHLEEKIRQEELNAYCAAIMKEPNYDEMIKISEAKIRHLEQLVISEKDVLVETKRRRRESMKQGANDASMGDPQGDTVYSRMPSDQAMYRTTVQDDDE
jgi:hypothetical protein